MKWIACVLVMLVVRPTVAQRLVVQSATTYRSATRLRLVETARWCRDAAAAGCDFAAITEAIATDDGGLLAEGYRGPIRLFDRASAASAVNMPMVVAGIQMENDDRPRLRDRGRTPHAQRAFGIGSAT